MTLEKALKANFHNTVNRLSVNSKVTSLVNKANDIINILKHEEKFKFLFLLIIFLKIERILQQKQNICFAGKTCFSLERSVFYNSKINRNLFFKLSSVYCSKLHNTQNN